MWSKIRAEENVPVSKSQGSAEAWLGAEIPAVKAVPKKAVPKKAPPPKLSESEIAAAKASLGGSVMPKQEGFFLRPSGLPQSLPPPPAKTVTAAIPPTVSSEEKARTQASLANVPEILVGKTKATPFPVRRPSVSIGGTEFVEPKVLPFKAPPPAKAYKAPPPAYRKKSRSPLRSGVAASSSSSNLQEAVSQGVPKQSSIVRQLSVGTIDRAVCKPTMEVTPVLEHKDELGRVVDVGPGTTPKGERRDVKFYNAELFAKKPRLTKTFSGARLWELPVDNIGNKEYQAVSSTTLHFYSLDFHNCPLDYRKLVSEVFGYLNLRMTGFYWAFNDENQYNDWYLGPKLKSGGRPTKSFWDVEKSNSFMRPRGHLYVSVPPGNEHKLVTAVELLDKIVWRHGDFVPGAGTSPTSMTACQLSIKELCVFSPEHKEFYDRRLLDGPKYNEECYCNEILTDFDRFSWKTTDQYYHLSNRAIDVYEKYVEINPKILDLYHQDRAEFHRVKPKCVFTRWISRDDGIVRDPATNRQSGIISMYDCEGPQSFREFRYGGAYKYCTRETVRESRSSEAPVEQLEYLQSGLSQTLRTQVSRVISSIGRIRASVPQFKLFRDTNYALASSEAQVNDEVSHELNVMRRQISRERLQQAEHHAEDHIQPPW